MNLYKQHEQMVYCHQQVHKALKSGLLIRPNYCEICRRECKPQAHHFDYNQPFQVLWVCTMCHILRVHRNKISMTTREIIEEFNKDSEDD